uniref:Major facilitator superfamily (MFS) profile domain-containing protein n=1 Tax=Anguilla anguilla TaxID=7936 RepID=A0A0E9UYM3_ANGAN
MKHVEEQFGKDANKEVLLMCIGITSGVGRLIFGRVADYVSGVNKVYLQVTSFLVIGLSVHDDPALQNIWRPHRRLPAHGPL